MSKKSELNLNSGITFLIVLFLIVLPISINRFGIQSVIDQLLNWSLGSIFVALLLFFGKKLWGKK